MENINCRKCGRESRRKNITDLLGHHMSFWSCKSSVCTWRGKILCGKCIADLHGIPYGYNIGGAWGKNEKCPKCKVGKLKYEGIAGD